MLRRDPLYNNIIPDTHYTQVDIVLRSKNSKTRLLREEKRRHFYVIILYVRFTYNRYIRYNQYEFIRQTYLYFKKYYIM